MNIALKKHCSNIGSRDFTSYIFEHKMILAKLSRFVFPSSCSPLRTSVRHTGKIITITKGTYAVDQIENIRAVLGNKVDNWTNFRTDILNIKGSINEKNIDGVLLKVMLNDKQYDTALSFAEYLKTSQEELNLGVINGLLRLYYEIGMKNKLTDEQTKFILNSYETLYDKYEVLDYATCERLLHALCVIDEWKKAFKVLDDIYLSGIPSHSTYSILIFTLFKLNKKKEALNLIEKSLRNRRMLTHIAYDAWINYILRKYKSKDTIVKYLEEICTHVALNCTILPEVTAEQLKETFARLGWHARHTRIRKSNGQCVYCKSTLECLKLSEDEFQLLQQNVKDKLIVGSDLLLKSSEEELKRFLKFVENTAPYDIVLDALNICYAVGKHKMDKIGPLTFVIEQFRQQNKKILLIGRKHMLKWPKMNYLLSKTCNFFTEDASQDDPYFITAAILSGSHTDFVSKDLLRGHRFQLQDEQLRHLFQRWQWQHQWKVFIRNNGASVVQAPLPVTPCAQKLGSGWHLPFEREEAAPSGLVRDGTPDWGSWLCLQPGPPVR